VSRGNTLESRERLPETVTHGEAVAAAAQAALLGAAIAAGDAGLLADAFKDYLHEPFRARDAPLLAELQRDPIARAAGVTLSGSGPSVIVWAQKDQVDEVASELGTRYPDARILPLEVADRGAELTEE
jgi:homoserine kinase